MPDNNTVAHQPNKHYGEVTLVGEQTDEMVQGTMQAFLDLNHDLSREYGEVRVIIDVSRLGTFNLRAQVMATRGFKTMSLDKCAIVGATEQNRKFIDLIVSLSGHESQVTFFDKRQDAELWLER